MSFSYPVVFAIIEQADLSNSSISLAGAQRSFLIICIGTTSFPCNCLFLKKPFGRCLLQFPNFPNIFSSHRLELEQLFCRFTFSFFKSHRIHVGNIYLHLPENNPYMEHLEMFISIHFLCKDLVHHPIKTTIEWNLCSIHLL